MVFLSLFQWWYGAGWLSAIEHAQHRLLKTYRLFSVPILLRTWFAPWRRIVTAPGAGIGAHMRAAVDNFISRFIGFLVRSIVLLTALVVLLFSAVVSLLELLSWPFIPLLVIVAPIAGAIVGGVW